MEYRHVGNSGLVVSTLGIGCGQLGRRPEEPGRRLISEDQSRAVVETALDAGVTFFDTSDSYGDSEELLGRYLGRHRDDVVIATKFGNSVKGALGNDFGARGARRYIRRAVERSLRRLRTDWIDLYQVHSPDPHTPIEETLSVLNDLVHEGTVRYIGSSNCAGWQIANAEWTSRTSRFERFISAQNRYNILDRRIEHDIVPACASFGIGLITWRPLADGLLTGKYRQGKPAPKISDGATVVPTTSQLETIERLWSFASDRGVSLLDVAIGGLVAQPQVATVIAGATSSAQVVANVAAAQWQPTAEDRNQLDQLTKVY